MKPQSPLYILRTSMGVALLFGVGLLLAAPGVADAATYTVTHSNDSGSGSLRQAILDANAHAGADRIEFNIIVGAPFIQPASALPDVSDGVYIDGWTQPGHADDPVVIDGTYAGQYTDGFHLTADRCTIRGLVIQRFGHAGIRAFGTSHHLIIGNHLGIGADGNTAQGNRHGVYIQSGTGCIIGGTTAADRNVISGNLEVGVVIATNAVNNQVLGNYVGLDAAGRAAVPNGTWGIWVTGSSFGTTIGGAGAGNVIAGNAGHGIWILDSDNSLVQGNIIGLDHAGSAIVGNGGNGIYFTSGANSLIGGTTHAARNVISGNMGNGILITGGSGDAGTRVQGNYVGTDDTGAQDRGNGGDGILLIAEGVTIGGLPAGAGNLISGNDGAGVSFFSYAAADTVQGNVIGLNASGTGALGNASHGIVVTEHATSLLIGAADPAGRNVISANGGDGIKTTGDGPTHHVRVIGNYIGTDVTGALDRGNAGSGLDVAGYLHFIGDDVGSGMGNLISGNDGLAGINLATSRCYAITIQGNSIGTALDGTALGNAGDGIAVRGGAHDNWLGGAPDACNTIAYNGLSGVSVLDDFTEAWIWGNSIYSNQQLGISLGGGTNPTPNDPLDADTGPNGLQNYPVLTLAAPEGAWGTLQSAALGEYRVELFASTACDPSGYGEGMRFLGAVYVTADDDGMASFYCPFETPEPPGSLVTGTATDSPGSTSEFSACMPVDPAAGIADGLAPGNQPTGPALSLNSPCRLGQAIRITYRVSAKEGSAVTLGLFDLSGRRIRTLVAGPQAHGTHELAWDGADDAGRPLPAGVYLCRLEVGGEQHRGRLVLIP
jgi:parallel beta-helix repeat protein